MRDPQLAPDQPERRGTGSFGTIPTSRAQRRGSGVRVGGRRNGKATAGIAAALAAPEDDLTAEEQAVADAIRDRVTEGADRLAVASPRQRPDLAALLVRTLARRAVAALHPTDAGTTRVDYLGTGRDDVPPQDLHGLEDAHTWLARERTAGRPARVIIRTTTLRELR